MAAELSDKAKFLINIGPASMHWGKPYIKIDGRQIGKLTTPNQLSEVVSNINNTATLQEVKNYMGCGTCKAAEYTDSNIGEELVLNAKVGGNKDKLQLSARCPVLVYASKNGFVQDANCMKSKKSVHLIVGAENKKASFTDLIKIFFKLY